MTSEQAKQGFVQSKFLNYFNVPFTCTAKNTFKLSLNGCALITTLELIISVVKNGSIVTSPQIRILDTNGNVVLPLLTIDPNATIINLLQYIDSQIQNTDLTIEVYTVPTGFTSFNCTVVGLSLKV